MSEKLPRLHAHFEQHKVDFSLITFNWFLVVFVDSVVSDILFKIWDAFLFEGPKVRSERPPPPPPTPTRLRNTWMRRLISIPMQPSSFLLQEFWKEFSGW